MEISILRMLVYPKGRRNSFEHEYFLDELVEFIDDLLKDSTECNLLFRNRLHRFTDA